MKTLQQPCGEVHAKRNWSLPWRALDSPVPIRPSDDLSPSQHLTATSWENSSQTAHSSRAWIPDPWESCVLVTSLLCPWDSPGKNPGVGSHSLLQGIFPTQGSNLSLLHCRWILYHLSHHESPVGTIRDKKWFWLYWVTKFGVNLLYRNRSLIQLGLEVGFAWVEDQISSSFFLSLCLLSCSVMSDSLWSCRLLPTRLLCPWELSRQEYWSGFSCPPPGDLPNPGIEPGSPTLWWILYRLSHQRSPRIQEWVTG